MWTCPKCGEAIEDQFDSCWKCASQRAPIPEKIPNRLKKSDFFTAAIMAYVIPWFAVIIQSEISWWRSAILTNGVTIGLVLAMLVPGVITFFALLPFMKSPTLSRFAALLLVFGWIWVSGALFPNIKIK
jgi:hypothetical protein